MKKLIFSALLALATLGLTKAQEQLKLLNVQETTQGIGVYPCGDRHEAMVQFVTSEPFKLSFESTHDNELDIRIDSVAGKKIYSIVLITQAPGQNYSARRLIIHAPGFQDYRLPLPLQDKQKFEYTISDPYSKLRSPFFIYFEKAQQSFKDGLYQEAKDNYELCRYCPEYANDSVRIINHISNCDSMMLWSEQALMAEHFHQYTKAIENYSKMLRYNVTDDLRSRLFKMQQDFTGDCEALMRMGQSYFNQGELERAEERLERVVENGCTLISADAAEVLTDIRKAKMRRDDHARTLMFAWSPNMMGLSWGNYFISRNHAWYGTLMLNADCINLVSQKSYPKGKVLGIPEGVTSSSGIVQDNLDFNYEKTMAGRDKEHLYPKDNKFEYETMFAIGCDWNVYMPLFIHFGVGYHGGGFNTFNAEKFYKACGKYSNTSIDFNDESTWTDEFRYEGSKINWFNSVAPEIGIVLKYWRLAIKGTYQYSYWFNTTNYEDFLKENTHNFQLGVGFCW